MALVSPEGDAKTGAGVQVFIWEALRPLEGRGKTGQGGKPGKACQRACLHGCRLWLPGARPAGEPGKQSGAHDPSEPAQGHRCAHSHWAWLRAAPGGRVPCTPGPVLRGYLGRGAGAGTRGLELCEFSRGWRARAVSVRGGRGVCPLQGAEDTGDTLHPAVRRLIPLGTLPPATLPSSPRPSHPERVKAF